MTLSRLPAIVGANLVAASSAAIETATSARGADSLRLDSARTATDVAHALKAGATDQGPSPLFLVANLLIALVAGCAYAAHAKNNGWRVWFRKHDEPSRSSAATTVMLAILGAWLIYYGLGVAAPGQLAHSLVTLSSHIINSFLLILLALVMIFKLSARRTTVALVVTVFFGVLFSAIIHKYWDKSSLHLAALCGSLGVTVVAAGAAMVCDKKTLVFAYGLILGVYSYVQDQQPYIHTPESLDSMYFAAALLKSAWVVVFYFILRDVEEAASPRGLAQG